MRNFYNYLESHYIMSRQAKEIIFDVCLWAKAHMTTDGSLTPQGVNFLKIVVLTNIDTCGDSYDNIIKEWK